jgi:DNA-binding HxlR family transcriptional regulator
MNTNTNNQKVKVEENCLDPAVCPVLATLDVVGGKWKPAILWQIRHEMHRFGALRRSVQGITQKMLTQQLRELEADGVIVRKVFAEVPPRVEYTLSDYGRSLQPLLDAMASWGAAHQARAQRRSRAKIA